MCAAGTFTSLKRPKTCAENAASPAKAHQIFTTVHDDQTEVRFVLLAGDAAFSAQVLGRFRLVNVPAAHMGMPRIQVDFRVSMSGMPTASARDLDTGNNSQWQQQCIVMEHGPEFCKLWYKLAIGLYGPRQPKH